MSTHLTGFRISIPSSSPKNVEIPRSRHASARTRAAEVRRRLCHMLPGIVALVLPLVPQPRPFALSDLVLISIMIFVLGGVIRYGYAAIARPGEVLWTTNVIKYCGTVIAMSFLFAWYPEFATVVTAVLAFGDGSATIFGLLFGKHSLRWNAEKTSEGAVAFLFCSIPRATMAYWLESQPTVPIPAAASCACSVALCGQFAETLPWKSSDNPRVGVAAAIGVVAGHLMVFGTLT